MPLVRFRASPEMRQWVHRKGGRRAEPLLGGRNARLVEPIILRDGDAQEMDAFDAQWATVNYPENFEIVEE